MPLAPLEAFGNQRMEDLQPCELQLRRSTATPRHVGRSMCRTESPGNVRAFFIPRQMEATMEHEIVVEGFVLQVEVTSCEEAKPAEYRNGSRELTFNILSGTMYDSDGIPMDVCQMELAVIAESKEYVPMIEKALWHEIDARKRHVRRWAA